MTPALDAERCSSTVNAADLLGIAAEAGTLEGGKRADLIAVAGDPIANIEVLKNVSFVMKDGKAHKHQ